VKQRVALRTAVVVKYVRPAVSYRQKNTGIGSTGTSDWRAMLEVTVAVTEPGVTAEEVDITVKVSRIRLPNKRYVAESNESNEEASSTKKGRSVAKHEDKLPQTITIADIYSDGTIQSPGMSRESLVQDIKNERYKRVAFLTGAGISVAAGIPDFRTPKTGLYSQLKDFGLPHPEEIFSLEFLLHAPEPFYAVANRYLQYKVQPTLAHHFIRQFVDQGTLIMDYTQNIDGLELDVGIPSDLLVQAHGHMRSAHCSSPKCRAEADMRLYTRHVRSEEVLYCKTCKDGIVKPDIVFFGEKLPKEFSQKFRKIEKADLVFVMGTSLKVAPFSTLLGSLPESTPLVVLNHTNPTSGAPPRENFLFLEGDIQASVQALMEDIGWAVPAEKLAKKRGKKEQ
jgi:NAD-dependent SIR2 family protein deacetylase